MTPKRATAQPASAPAEPTATIRHKLDKYHPSQGDPYAHIITGAPDDAPNTTPTAKPKKRANNS